MKISSMHDLQIAKERYSYEVKLYEQTLSTSFHNIRKTARDSFKNTLYQFGQTLAIVLLKQIFLTRKRS